MWRKVKLKILPLIFLFVLLQIPVHAEDIKQSEVHRTQLEKSKVYYEEAKKLFDYEAAVSGNIFQKFQKIGCPGCDSYDHEESENSYVFEFKDVEDLLNRSLILNKDNKDSLLLLSTIQWMNSYMGEGMYDQSALKTAKKNILHAIEVNKDKSFNKDANAILEKINKSIK